MRAFPMALVATAMMAPCAGAAELPAIVQKPVADVYAQPAFDAPKVTTLPRNTAVTIAAQQGLWYQLHMPEGTPGYVRVNDVRINQAGTGDGEANLRVLMGGKAGQGRVTETAGVRGIDESDLKAAAFDQARLSAMLAYRVDAAKAAAYAAEEGWHATQVAYAAEARRSKNGGKSAQGATPSTAATAKAVTGMLGSLGGEVSSMFSGAAKVAPKGEGELAAQELALGPEITGRILGARPLLDEALAQWRVNLVGQWVASQTSRPELPWTFGVIDTPEVNAFAAPGGYILVTRGLYELLASDSELAAVLAHEIGHCVQRDHYNVIRKQEMATAGKDLALRDIDAGNDSAAGKLRPALCGAARCGHHADRARSRGRVSRRRERRGLPGPCRVESAGAVFGPAEIRRAGARLAKPGATVQDPSSVRRADRSHRPAWLWRAGALHHASVIAPKGHSGTDAGPCPAPAGRPSPRSARFSLHYTAFSPPFRGGSGCTCNPNIQAQ